jgi:LPXTG-motif cell wall-anchored protein
VRAEGVAPDGVYATGEYEATVVVPKGGIGVLEIGLRGWVSGPTGTRRSDLLFPITNHPVPRLGTHASAASRQPDSERSDTGSTMWVLILAAGALFSLAVLAVGRKRSRSATYPPM